MIGENEGTGARNKLWDCLSEILSESTSSAATMASSYNETSEVNQYISSSLLDFKQASGVKLTPIVMQNCAMLFICSINQCMLFSEAMMIRDQDLCLSLLIKRTVCCLRSGSIVHVNNA